VDLTKDHKALESALETRRYFAKFERIISYLPKVMAEGVTEGVIGRKEAAIIQGYVTGLSSTFSALSHKYLLAGRVSRHLPSLLSIDRQESGFPVYQELLQMANDAAQADGHLAGSDSAEALKAQMVRHILNHHTTPTKLQYALSQRLYNEFLVGRELYWAQNDPQAVWMGAENGGQRRSYLVHWASYDSQQNIPTIYIMNLEDTGDMPLVQDNSRWPRVQNHLMSQAMASLKMVTIATGFDTDFDHLHPKRLQRIHVGPMYSHTFTEQSGPLRDVLAEADGPPGLDWALAWTYEDLVSERITEESTGWFSSAEREIYQLDPFAEGAGSEHVSGATEMRRSLILPQRAYQVLAEHNPPGLAHVRKYVVSGDDRVMSFH